jgi:hypothetical protein
LECTKHFSYFNRSKYQWKVKFSFLHSSFGEPVALTRVILAKSASWTFDLDFFNLNISKIPYWQGDVIKNFDQVLGDLISPLRPLLDMMLYVLGSYICSLFIT